MRQMKSILVCLLLSLTTYTTAQSIDETFRTWALTPPMGWNSWDCYYSSVTEKEVLQNAQLLHPILRDGFNLQHTSEVLFHGAKLFEHSRILVEALAQELTSYEQSKEDLFAENEMIKSIYQHFFK